MPNRLVIAVDGPAASGKGTLAKKLAAHFDLPYLDTGLLYRAVGKKLLDGSASSKEAQHAIAIQAARTLTPEDTAQSGLGTEAMGYAASVVSAIPEVREALFDYQRQFAAQPQGAVLDGRDIGTVICPNADVKLYVSASAKVRAERRHEQLVANGTKSNFGSVLTAILERDERDSTRGIAPLKPAEDAITLDTSNLTIEQVMEAALDIIRTKTAITS